MKKRLAVGGVVLSLLAILGIGTAAYFVTDGTAQNEIQMGTVDLTLTETLDLGSGVITDPTMVTLSGVLPGEVVKQSADIENSGEQPFWTRVRVGVEILDQSNNALPTTVENAYGVEVPVISFNISTANPLGDEPTGNWVEKDGWYYYTGAVEKGDTVTPFTEVTFAAEAGNDYQGCSINITVEAQGVQVKHNEIPEGGSILDVKGWPGTETVDPEEPTTPVEPEEPTTEPVTP